MKKPYIYSVSFILILGLSLPFSSVSAQIITPDPAVEGAATTDTQVNLQDLKNQPLEMRRQVVSAQLTIILNKLNVLYDRTKTAMDSLSTKGIDTSKAQVELALVADSLANAKASIDVFTNLDVHFKPTASQPTPLRDAVVKAETSLRESREHIINTLLLLKASISANVQ